MLSFNQSINCANFKLIKSTNSFSHDLCNHYNETYFKSSRGITELLQKNISMLSCVDNSDQKDKDKDVEYDDLENTSKQNPLFTFSECFADDCGLNRKSSGIFRTFMENKTIELIKHNYNTNKHIIYTSYLSGFFLQDIVLLTKMKDVIDPECMITINLIGNSHDYLALISNSLHNPNAKNNCINYEFEDTHKYRKMWAKLFTYRLIKFLEWFQAIGLNVNLNLYSNHHNFINDCHNNNELLSDITVGIDHVDQSIISEYDFKMLALCTTKKNGYIVSLRTDGIPFLWVKLNYHFTMYMNENPLDNMEKYNNFRSTLNELKKDAEKNRMEIKGELFNENNKQEIEKDGKFYYLKGSSCCIDGSFLMYETNEYKNYKSQIDMMMGESYILFDNISKECVYIYDLHGTYKFAFGMMYYTFKDMFCNYVTSFY